MHQPSKASKLTLLQVVEMRELYGEGKSQGFLARAFRVSVGQVGRIVRGESWQTADSEEPPEVAGKPPTAEEIEASLKKLQGIMGEAFKPSASGASLSEETSHE